VSPSHRLARRAATVSAAVVGMLCAAQPASALPSGWEFSLSIKDYVGLPGQATPDSVRGSYYRYWWEPAPVDAPTSFDLEVQRDGVKIAGGNGTVSATLADLRAGDVVVWRANTPGNPEVGRTTYTGKPRLDAPVCAGKELYYGTRDADSDPYLYVHAVRWEAGYPGEYPGYPGYPDYPGYPSYPTPPWWSYLPGWYPGYGPAFDAYGSVIAYGDDRFVVAPPKGMTAGTHLYISQYRWISSLSVSVQTDHVVADCAPGPSPSPMPAPTPAPTPTSVPQSEGGVRPTGDVTAPNGALTGLTSKSLRKLGRGSILSGGVPVTIVSDELARFSGKLTVLGGKRPLVTTIEIAVLQGATPTRIPLNKALKKQLAKIKKPRLRLEGQLTDAAGNRRTLAPVTVDLPRR
jgi:hypothetical protein